MIISTVFLYVLKADTSEYVMHVWGVGIIASCMNRQPRFLGANISKLVQVLKLCANTLSITPPLTNTILAQSLRA